MGPGSPTGPFAAPPAAAGGLIAAGTTKHVVTSADEEPHSQHALGRGRVGSGVTVVELRTNEKTVRWPVVPSAGYFMVFASDRNPSIAVHFDADDPGTTP